MKRTILAVLIVAMIATPCFAQKIEPDGLFSIEGTLWNVCRIGIKSRPPYFYPPECNSMGFHNGNLYSCYETGCSDAYSRGFYIDSPVLSIAFNPPGLDLYVMQPTSGIGLYLHSGCGGGYGVTCYFLIGMMLKVENNWAPPEEE